MLSDSFSFACQARVSQNDKNNINVAVPCQFPPNLHSLLTKGCRHLEFVDIITTGEQHRIVYQTKYVWVFVHCVSELLNKHVATSKIQIRLALIYGMSQIEESCFCGKTRLVKMYTFLHVTCRTSHVTYPTKNVTYKHLR
jgi:hypothetical protein